MKLLITALFLLICQGPVLIEGKNYSGYIFPADHTILMSIEGHERYTPSKIDIMLAERLLLKQLKKASSGMKNQSDGCPVIHKKLADYKRQYVGFISPHGEKILWINFIWKDRIPDEKLMKDIIQVKDGCSYYWTIKANLFTLTLHDLTINGQG